MVARQAKYCKRVSRVMPHEMPYATPYDTGHASVFPMRALWICAAHSCTLLQGLPYGLMVAVHALPLKA